MATTAELTTYLEQAERAYHELLTGKSVVEFRDSNGEQVRYTQISIRALGMYIESLKRQLGIGCSGPMRVWF